uniref:BHLH domain-containing protein n=2 Tax=Kalmanozyma brasiliensis (strain GHG001) TaxID=1365824 RepID=V5F1S1_KALBG
MEPVRSGPYPRGDEPYGPPSSKFAHSGPYERNSPPTDEAWRTHDRFPPAKEYSPRMPPWQRSGERMPAPPAAGMRDEGAWRSAPPPGHPEYARERAMEEQQRWREDQRARPPAYGYENGPGFGPGPHYAQGRPMEDLAEDARRVRPRTGEDDARYSAARPYGPGPYSPPEPRRHSAAPGQAPMRMMAGMEPPRPNTAAGTSVAPAPAPPTTVNANRRVAHLLSEQKRRESINTGFEDLRQAIPACRDGQDSKATILKRALEYIRELEGVVDRQHRMPMESHPISYGNHRSPPDDKDDLRRFGRPGGDEERRGAGQMAGGSGSSSSSEAGNGPRVGGLPSNAFGKGIAQGFTHASAPQHMREYRPYSPHAHPAHPPPTEASRVNGASPGVKRWAEDSDEDDRSPARRRVSDGDKDEASQRSSAGPYYFAVPPPPIATHARSPLAHSQTMLDQPRADWHPRMEGRPLVDSAVRV